MYEVYDVEREAAELHAKTGAEVGALKTALRRAHMAGWCQGYDDCIADIPDAMEKVEGE